MPRHGASIVQAEGHIANDSGDSASELAGLSLRPFPHAASPPRRSRRRSLSPQRARVAANVAAIVVESPFRRGFGSMVPLDEQAAIAALASANGIAIHLDGARLYIAAGFLGCPVRDLAAAYDTVYVSLYKYFGVPFGAILAGPASIIDGLYHDRRRFGGGLNQMWPIAILADAALDGLEASWAATADRARAVIDRLRSRGLAVEEAPNGTNVFRLRPDNPEEIAARAFAAEIKLPPPAGGVYPVKANASWTAMSQDVVVSRLASVFLG